MGKSVQHKFQSAPSEAHLGKTLEHVSDVAIVTLDPQGLVMSWNESAHRIKGWTAEEIVGKPYELFFNQHDRAAGIPLKILDEVRAKDYYAGEVWRVRKDGTAFFAHVRLTAMRDEAGALLGFVKVTADITEQHKAALMLQEQAKLLDLAHEAIIHRDLKGIVSFWNKGAERMYGLKREEVLGKSSHELLETEFPQPLAEITAALDKGGFWEGELFQRLQGGKRIIVQSKWVLHTDEFGTKILEVNSDITDRKRAEIELHESRTDLNRAQAVAHVGSWRLGVGRNDLSWSDETYRIFGVPEGTAMTYETFIAKIHPDDREFVDRSWQAALRGEPYDIEHRIIVGTDVKWVRERAELEFDRQGKLSGGFGTVQDITERKRAEEEIRHMASFPETNPNPVVEADVRGNILYANPATLDVLRTSGGVLDARAFLPSDFSTITSAQESSFHREVILGGQVFSESIYIWKDSGVVRIYARDITERTRAEQALRESEQLFRELADAMPQIVWSSRSDGTMDYYNQRWYEYTGFSPELIGDQSWMPILHPDDSEPAQQAWYAAVRTGKPFQAECRFKDWKTGGYRWFLGRALPVDDESGRIIRWFGSWTDIDDQKRAEAAIREREERFRTLAESLPEFVWTGTKDGLYDYISPQLAAYTGKPASAMLGNGWLECLHHDDRQATVDAWQAAAASRSAFHAEYRVRRNDGQYRRFKAQAIPLHDEWGNIIKWVGSSSDIEDERHIIDRLKFLARISDIVGYSAELPFFDQDDLEEFAKSCVPFLADWCAIDFLEDDDALRRMAVASSDEEKVRRSAALGKRHVLRSSAGMTQVLREKTPKSFPVVGEDALKVLARSAEHLEFLRTLALHSAVVVPLVARGKCLGVITFATAESGKTYNSDDVTFMVEVARRLSISVDNSLLYTKTTQALALRDDFLSIASHELKTPVTSIKAFLQALEKRMARPQEFDFAKNREYMELSIRQVDRLASLINDLLDINRINKGTMEYHFTLTQLGPVVAEVVERMSVSFPMHKMALWLEDLTTEVNVDLLRFEQALTNLIANAVKYSPESSTVDIVMRSDGSKVIISITDRGIGIPEEQQERIFDPYYRTPGAIKTRASGLGIGLFISSQIIKAHSGTLSVHSEQGKGSTFTITLPVA